MCGGSVHCGSGMWWGKTVDLMIDRKQTQTQGLGCQIHDILLLDLAFWRFHYLLDMLQVTTSMCVFSKHLESRPNHCGGDVSWNHSLADTEGQLYMFRTLYLVYFCLFSFIKINFCYWFFNIWYLWLSFIHLYNFIVSFHSLYN